MSGIPYRRPSMTENDIGGNAPISPLVSPCVSRVQSTSSYHIAQIVELDPSAYTHNTTSMEGAGQVPNQHGNFPTTSQHLRPGAQSYLRVETDGPLDGSTETTSNPTQSREGLNTSRAGYKPTSMKAPRPKPISWWWWWEILAMILSIACMCILVVLLTKIHNLPLQSWWLPIQPNSLIAALTTVAKTSMMVPAASCISQLKWRHFTLRSRRLVDLQLFDDASRGPWGAAILIWSVCLRARVLITFGFAFVTIVALGIDTCAQQVLDFPLQESPLNNASVEMGVADMYFSKAFLADSVYEGPIWKPNSDLLALQSSIINGATGSVFQPNFNCSEPATRCAWDTFTTLGVCQNFTNVTDVAVPDCAPEDKAGNLNCTYSFPGMINTDTADDPMVMSWNQENTGGAGPTTMLFQSEFRATGPLDLFGAFTAVKASTNGYPTFRDEGEGLNPPEAQVYYSTFGWCAQTFQKVTASQSGIRAGSMTSEGLTISDASHVEDDGNLMGAEYREFIANSTGAVFNVSTMAVYSLKNYLSTLLAATVQHNIYRPDTGPDQRLLEIGFALYNSDLGTVVSDIADTVTNQIRSSSPGDNYNATTLTGSAFFNETYIRVRWPWMILPLAETILATVLLAASIVITHRQPMLKQSLIALLTNRLEGWSDDELDVAGPQTQEKLDDLAETMLARLEADGLGRLRLVRKEFD